MGKGYNKSNLVRGYGKCDSVVKSVVNSLVKRAATGRAKYGTDLDRTDLSMTDWVVHAQEELMDGILYLERIKRCDGEAGSHIDSRIAMCVDSRLGAMHDDTMYANDLVVILLIIGYLVFVFILFTMANSTTLVAEYDVSGML